MKTLNKTPRITLLGAGPGDPDLLTIKGMKVLQTANVVLYDALVNEDILSYAPPKAIKVYVGKRAGDHSYSQEAINKLMVDYALNYGHVIRLKGGDPFVFGRGYEELAYANSYHIPVSLIPGISSAVGVPGLQQIPVTHRGLSESFWVITGTTSNGNLAKDIHLAANSEATVIVLMGLNKLAQIVAIYEAAGRNNLPVAVIQNGSLANEKIVTGRVNTILAKVKTHEITAPAILVFGAVVSLHSTFKSLIGTHACLV